MTRKELKSRLAKARADEAEKSRAKIKELTQRLEKEQLRSHDLKEKNKTLLEKIGGLECEQRILMEWIREIQIQANMSAEQAETIRQTVILKQTKRKEALEILNSLEKFLREIYPGYI